MENNENEKKFTYGIIDNKTAIIIFGAVLLFILIPLIFGGGTSNDNVTSTPPITRSRASYNTTEALVLIDYSYIDSVTSWITPYVDYKFKVRSERHFYFIQFSSVNGGWTKKTLIKRDTNLQVPSNGTQGPLRITAGPKETKRFRVQLYKRIRVRM